MPRYLPRGLTEVWEPRVHEGTSVEVLLEAPGPGSAALGPDLGQGVSLLAMPAHIISLSQRREK